MLKKVGICIAASTTPGPTRIRLWPNPEPGAKGPEGPAAKAQDPSDPWIAQDPRLGCHLGREITTSTQVRFGRTCHKKLHLVLKQYIALPSPARRIRDNSLLLAPAFLLLLKVQVAFLLLEESRDFHCRINNHRSNPNYALA